MKVRRTEEQQLRLRVAAESEGLDLSTWLRSLALKEAARLKAREK